MILLRTRWRRNEAGMREEIVLFIRDAARFFFPSSVSRRKSKNEEERRALFFVTSSATECHDACLVALLLSVL